MSRLHHRVLAVALLAVVSSTSLLFGQIREVDAVAPVFDVATIKQNTSPNVERHIFRSATGLTGTNMTARQLILFAYTPFQSFQLFGGPSWIDKDPYCSMST